MTAFLILTRMVLSHFIAEYSTKRELLSSLKDGDTDIIWLLDLCDINEDLFTIVDIADESPSVGMDIRVEKGHANLIRCLEEDDEDDNEDDYANEDEHEDEQVS